MSEPTATAIIVTYNSESYIGEALTALRRAELTVRVVDNASRDGTVSLIIRAFPDVELIANPINVGFAAAVNQALVETDSDVVLLVNPDCVLPAATARALIRVVRGSSEIGIAGPRLINAAGHAAISAHPFESLISVLASRFGGSLAPVALRRILCGTRRRRAYDACREPSGPLLVDWLSGACLAVRTDLMRRVGGLNESYFMYYEDEELCLQAWRCGASVVYLPTVEAMHVGGASSSDPTRIWPHLYRSMLLFFARNRRSTFGAVRAAILLRALIGIGLAGVRLPVQPGAGAARFRAWTTISRIALTATPESLEIPESLEREPCTF